MLHHPMILLFVSRSKQLVCFLFACAPYPQYPQVSGLFPSLYSFLCVLTCKCSPCVVNNLIHYMLQRYKWVFHLFAVKIYVYFMDCLNQLACFFTRFLHYSDCMGLKRTKSMMFKSGELAGCLCKYKMSPLVSIPCNNISNLLLLLCAGVLSAWM